MVRPQPGGEQNEVNIEVITWQELRCKDICTAWPWAIFVQLYSKVHDFNRGQEIGKTYIVPMELFPIKLRSGIIRSLELKHMV